MERKSSASEQTRQALAEALKELMAQKPVDKITIHDLTERCGIRRQNFYYHFEDVYDLMRWMFEEEADSLLRQHEGTLLWQEGLLQIFHYLEANRAVCRCALKSEGQSSGWKDTKIDKSATSYIICIRAESNCQLCSF